MNKICTKCDYIKPQDLFPRSEQSRDGYFDVCKKCINSGTVSRYESDATSGIVPNVNVVYTPPRVDPTPVAPVETRNAMPDEHPWGYPPKRKIKRPRTGRKAWMTPEEKDMFNRNYTLQNHYGITQKQYEEMVEAQGNGCAICKKIPTNTVYRYPLVVDKNKSTNKLRGIVCRKCKLIITNAEENVERLFTTIEYLEKSSK